MAGNPNILDSLVSRKGRFEDLLAYARDAASEDPVFVPLDEAPPESYQTTVKASNPYEASTVRPTAAITPTLPSATHNAA